MQEPCPTAAACSRRGCSYSPLIESWDYTTFLFANVGSDSEHPDTLRYPRGSRPFRSIERIDLIELHRIRRRGEHRGEVETLRGRLMRPGSRSLLIPVRVSNGASGARSGTADFKVAVAGRWLREHGATIEQPATVAPGISVDEIERAHPGIDPRARYQHRTYPLLDLGLRRSDCRRVIADAGLPVLGQSACYLPVPRQRSVAPPQARAPASSPMRVTSKQRSTIAAQHSAATPSTSPAMADLSPSCSPTTNSRTNSNCDSGYYMS